jgi:hypothetical protein
MGNRRHRFGQGRLTADLQNSISPPMLATILIQSRKHAEIEITFCSEHEPGMGRRQPVRPIKCAAAPFLYGF